MAEQFYEPVQLRVEPEAIPHLRAAFEKALAILAKPIRDLGEVGRIQGAWMGDPKSQEVADLYNARVMEASDGQYQALLRYQEQLTQVRDQLDRMEQQYRRAEDENVTQLGGGVL